MSHQDLLEEIEELNLAYLLLAQRMLDHDREAAMFRLKIGEEMANLLQSLSARQMAQLSRTNQLLFHFAFDSAERLRQVTHNPREQGLSCFHAALLMASRSSGESVAVEGGA